MGIYRRLERDDGLLRVYSFAHLLRDAKEAIVGQVTPTIGGNRTKQP
jgi:hypothetical protein